MPAYEICVLKDDRYSAATVHERFLLNDEAAISQAARLAGDAPFEVWRGLDCIWGLASARCLSPAAGTRHVAGRQN